MEMKLCAGTFLRDTLSETKFEPRQDPMKDKGLKMGNSIQLQIFFIYDDCFYVFLLMQNIFRNCEHDLNTSMLMAKSFLEAAKNMR